MATLRQFSKTDKLLIGQGFDWTHQHTEALLRYDRLKVGLPTLDGGAIGIPALHGVGAHQQRLITAPCEPQFGHMAIEGVTRCGKSTLMTSLAVQEIYRNNGPVVVVDPKGDAYMAAHIIQAAHQAGRNLRIFAPYFCTRGLTPESNKLVVNLNPFSTCDMPESIIARMDPMFGTPKGDPFFKNNALRNILRMARIHEAIGKRWTIQDIYSDLEHPSCRAEVCAMYMELLGVRIPRRIGKLEPRAVVEAYSQSTLEDDLANECVKLLNESQDHYESTMGNLGTAVMGLVGSPMSHLLCDEPALTWARIDQEEMVVLVLTTSMLMGEIGNRFGRLLLQDLMGYCGHRLATSTAPVHKPINIFIDEIGQIGYPDLASQAAVMGGANAKMTVAYQTRASAVHALGKEKAEELFGNFDTKLYFRLPDAGAEEASKQFGTCEISRFLRQAARETGGRGGKGTTLRENESLQNKEPLVSPQWLSMLPNGHFFIRSPSGLKKAQGPLLEDADIGIAENLGLGQIIHEIRREQATYASAV